MGSSGAGKTFVSQRIAKKFNLQHVNLDDIILIRDEQGRVVGKPETREYIKAVKDHLEKIDGGWVADGVYPKLSDDLWPLADFIVWLDYDFDVVRARFDERAESQASVGLFADASKHKREHYRLQKDYEERLAKLPKDKPKQLRITGQDTDILMVLKSEK